MKSPRLIIVTFLIAISVSFAPFLAGSARGNDTGEELGTLEDLLPQRNEKSGPRSFDGRIQLFDHLLFHPMPVWSLVGNGAAPGERTKFDRNRKGNAFRIDFVPKEEDFKDWKSRFSIIAFNNSNVGLVQQARRLGEFIRSECSPRNLRIFPGNRTQSRLVLVSSCGNYSRKRDTGEMIAAVIIKRGKLMVTLMRQWRAPAFQASIRSDWPIPRREIDGVLSELLRSRLVPMQP